jgi:hypothetical protein
MGLLVAAPSIVSVFLIVLTPGPAWADCGLLDTSCIVGTVEDTADGAVGTVEETVDETVDQVVAVVENVEDTVEKTADKVVETVEETVDDTVDTVEDTVETVDAVDPVAPLPPEEGSEQGSNDPPGNGSRPDTETSVVRPRDRDRSAPTLEEVALVSETSPASDAVLVTGTVSTSPFDPFGPFAGSLPEVARALAFPLVLLGLVLGFVAVQNRLDRKDPKLALATTTPDVLTFE